jgi:hypothetical protein
MPPLKGWNGILSTALRLGSAVSGSSAGLPDHCTLHGVRKNTASQLAEEGATPHQIGSVTGHTTLKEIERYTAKARRKRLATEAIGKLK